LTSEAFAGLTDAVSGTPPFALLASAAWGVLSVVLSPCHLASIPLIVGFIGEQGRMATKRAFMLALVFSSGILATIGLIGVATAALGRMLGDLGPHVNYIVAIIFFIIGLHFLGIIPLPFSTADTRMRKRRGILAGFVLGLVFGLALGPCTFAFMAPMLGITLSVARTNTAYGILLLTAYGIGHCGVIVAAGTSTEAVQRYLRWSGRSRGLEIIKKVCGLLVMLGGAYLIWSR
jgi:cytochrome c-type biogenesis protein